MMKFFTNILFALALATAFLVGCDKPGTDNPEASSDVYGTFRSRFILRSTASWRSLSDERYMVSFGGVASMTLRDGQPRVAVCTPDTWPAVVLRDGNWHIDGEDTGVAFTGDRANEEILIVIYDTEGVYVRLSSGYMFYFHSNEVREVGCFRFEKALNPSLSEDIVCRIGSSAISINAGVAADLSDYRLVPTFASRGELALAGGEGSLSSSFSLIDISRDVSLDLVQGSDRIPYTLSFSEIKAIPVLHIDTGRGGNIPKDTYVTGRMRVNDPDLAYASIPQEAFDIEIHGRGNTTWGLPKKPYKVKLAEKRRLLGMSDNRNWVLLANYSDKSLLRNSLAFELSKIAGMPWPIRWVPVELYIDNVYQGVYSVVEHVRPDAERVEMEIVEPHHNSGEAITGGYLLYIDEKAVWDKGEGFEHRYRAGMLPVAYDTPERPTPEQQAYIKSYLREVEDAIYDKSFAEYSEVIDTDSFIKYFFVQEIARNMDGNMRLSTYVAKPRGGKLYFPCVWDFDIAFDNCDYHAAGTGYQGWYIRDAVWMRQLFSNPEFCDRVTEEWGELYPKLADVETTIRDWAKEIDDAQRRNFQTWPILGVHIWPNVNAQSRSTYEDEVDYLVHFFKRRVEWMNTQINAGNHRIVN